MRKVELVDGIKSSVLGFGCAPILGAVDAIKAKIAIETALYYGINHFDLARSYGYGEAEKFVGKLLKPNRPDVVIATKFGINANWKAQVLRPVKPLIRALKNSKQKKQSVNLIPSANTGANYADKFFDRIPLTAKEMETSVEKSLKSLQTDYLDYLFIHEPIESIINVQDLFEMAEKMKKQGKIRAFGLAFMRNQTSLHELYLNQFELLQFDNSPGADGYSKTVDKRGLKSNVIFSPLRGGSNDLSADEKLKKLTMDFPQSVILCSMFNPKHIINNASLFD